MKYALMGDEKVEALPGLRGICRNCESPVIAKCGEINVYHWAHQKIRRCDSWWENETEWHRAWKNVFPIEWQEVVHRAENGVRHIADVKTDQGYVIEFQRSPIDDEERQSRENFYKKMIWIVDGCRRLRDKEKFLDGVRFSPRIDGRDDLRESPGRGPLLRDWIGRTVPVFFDLGDDILWALLPETTKGKKYGFCVVRNVLIEALRSAPPNKKDFDALLMGFTGKIESHEWYLKRQSELSQRSWPLNRHSRF